MSRIIVKNLPKGITAEKLQDVFQTKGVITDLQLKFNKDGKFRQFAFIGYKTEKEAKAAKEYYNNTYLLASKLKIEICSSLGDSDKVKAWSKLSKLKKAKDVIPIKQNDDATPKDESLLETKEKEGKKTKADKKDKSKKGTNKSELAEIPEELQNDTLFAEFLELNKDRKSKPVWKDDAVTDLTEQNADEDEKSQLTSDDDDDKEAPEPEVARNKDISDMEYFKTKIKSKVSLTDVSTEKAKADKAKNIPKKKKNVIYNESFTVKLSSLPFRCKKSQIKKFFHPLKPISLRLPRKSKGFAFVMFKSEKELKQALHKDKLFLDGHRIDVVKHERKVPLPEKAKEGTSQVDAEKSAELLAESGRIFVRNLCFSVTEKELEKLFSRFGPLAEINLPIDSHTKNGMGFAFITYVFAEHAVKAFSDLDGSIFQGRLLHLIPANPKKETTTETSGMSFKKQKEVKLKALSGSSHNWNTLFLGLNAIADVMSKKYNIDKSELLSSDSKESVAVRMALGETQIVVETRQFLVENGVELDAFSQPNAERSKTVIIAKNLPANTESKEIYEVFSKHGIVSRVVLPPSGITALIEFQEIAEAKAAFKKLAYSRFHHVPLYLEWAPMNALKEAVPEKIVEKSDVMDESNNKKSEAEIEQQSEADNQEPEPETTLFIKNLNFDTTEDDLKKHFKKCGPIHLVSISKKKDMNSGKMLSMGFGFVQFKKKGHAKRALQDLQLSQLDGHELEVKLSNRATIPHAESARRKALVQEQKSSKILVRNIPFEVTEAEVRDLFKEFGNLKSVRLPKKMSGEGTHRGFGFVDFNAMNNAKRAFDALCHSTHLLGRRIVLEWANPDSDTVTEMRKKTARDFYSDGPRTKVKKSKLIEDVMTAKNSKRLEDEDDDDDELM